MSTLPYEIVQLIFEFIPIQEFVIIFGSDIDLVKKHPKWRYTTEYEKCKYACDAEHNDLLAYLHDGNYDCCNYHCGRDELDEMFKQDSFWGGWFPWR